MTVESGAIDSRAMYSSSLGVPEQVAGAHQAAQHLSLKFDHPVGQVVVIGAEVARLAGEALAALCRPVAPVPILAIGNHDLPAFVSPSTLAFIVTMAEDGGETGLLAEQARPRGARTVVMGEGERVEELANAMQSPWLKVSSDGGVERAHSLALIVQMAVIMERHGFFTDGDRAIEDARSQLERRRSGLTSEQVDLASTIANQLGRSFPLVYGSEGIGSVAAQYWKAQVNLNAKSPAFYRSQPTASFDEVAGFGQAGDITRQLITIVQLHTSFENPKIRRRTAVAGELIREAIAGFVDVQAEGVGAMAQLFDLILLGELVSLHLAARSGIDPGPTPVLDDIEQELTEHTARVEH